MLLPREEVGMYVFGRTLLTVVLCVVMGSVVAGAATFTGEGASAPGKPAIGKPSVKPGRAIAGRPFSVTFRVTRRDSGRPISRGQMVCHPTIAGKVIRHTESFRRGLARISFVVPANAAGKTVRVKVTIRANRQSATRIARFRVLGPPAPSVAVADTSATEGNESGGRLSFAVTLSAPATQSVSVDYATADGSATAPSDYTAASGTLTFKRGETTKTIPVEVVADTAIEQDETVTLSLTNAVNAVLGRATATGTIVNDDVQVPVTPGAYKGATQEGNYVFFTVLPDRTLTGFRVNDLPCECEPYGSLTGGENFSGTVFGIHADGSFSASGSWTGSDVVGDVEWTGWTASVSGRFETATSATGTIVVTYELNYKGTHFRCSSREKSWAATLQG
jgi:hypothetical protein